VDSTPSPVLVERDASVTILTLNRPERLNAVNPDLYRELKAALDEIEADQDVRAVVLTGAGRGFCVGADLKSHSEGSMPAEQRRECIGLAQTVNAGLQHSRVPVVAAVNGHAPSARGWNSLCRPILFSSLRTRSSASLKSPWVPSSVEA